MATSITEYLEALDATGVPDLPPSVKLDMINMARTEIVDAYPWPFRENRYAGSHGMTITDPWTTPMSAPGSEYVGVFYAYNENGMKLTPKTEHEFAAMGVTFSPDDPVPTDFVGTPLFYCVFYVMGTDISESPVPPRETYVIPFPYGPISVIPLIDAVKLDETYNPYETLIPDSFKLIVVYRAAVHAYTRLGVTDLADLYQQRFTELMEAMRRNMLSRTFTTPDIEYETGP